MPQPEPKRPIQSHVQGESTLSGLNRGRLQIEKPRCSGPQKRFTNLAEGVSTVPNILSVDAPRSLHSETGQMLGVAK
jgi:hypothetical protein